MTQQAKQADRKAKMLEALEKNCGIVTTAASSCGLSRRIHYDWLKNDENYRKAVEEIDNVVLDKAESALYNAIDEGDLTAIIFLLKTKGKKRGYIEKLDAAALMAEAELRQKQAKASIEQYETFGFM